MSHNSTTFKATTLEDFDATGTPPTPSSSASTNSGATPNLAATPPIDSHATPPRMMDIPRKKKPTWYVKAQEKRESKNTQACLEDYFADDAFRLGKGESIETVLEGFDVAIMWDVERNKIVGYPRPTLETSYRRRVIHDVLFQDYNEEYDYSDDDEC